jgi:hypothetical protein
VTRTWIVKLAIAGAALELFCGAFAWWRGGPMAAVAALIGASVATAAQVTAVALLRPAMQAPGATFQQRWVIGMAIRFGSFLAIAALILALKTTLPPLWVATGYLCTLLALLFGETTFLHDDAKP